MKVENCDNNFCCFWEDGQCVLDKITVDEYGSCVESVRPDIPADYLEYKRRELRKKILEG